MSVIHPLRIHPLRIHPLLKRRPAHPRRWFTHRRVRMLLVVATVATVAWVRVPAADAAAPHGDCDAVAWSSIRSGSPSREVFVADASDGARRNITRRQGLTAALEPMWFSPGAPIVFRGIPVGEGAGGIYSRFPVDDVGRISAADVESRGLAVTVDWIAYFADIVAGAGTLHLSAVSGEGVVTAGEGAIFDGSSATFAPGGDRVAWIGRSIAAVEDLYVVDVGREEGVITPVFASAGLSVTDIWAPQWSADGTRILVVASVDAEARPWVVDLAAGTVTPLGDPRPLDTYDVAWSPGGTLVAWDQVVGAERVIVVADAAGRERARVETGDPEVSTRTPFWSPDGAWIAFEWHKDETSRIAAVRPDGTDFRFVSPANHVAVTIEGWTADARSIVWTRLVGAEAEVFAAGVEPQEPVALSDARLVTTHGPPGVGIEDPIDAIDVRPADGFTEVVAFAMPFEGGLSIAVNNAGDCDALPHLVWPSSCDLLNDADSDGSRSSFSLGRIGPNEARRGDFAVGHGGCTGEVVVVAANAAPTRIAVDIAPFGGGYAPCEAGPTPFTDIAGSFAERNIACIFGLGITQGTSPTTYSPAHR